MLSIARPRAVALWACALLMLVLAASLTGAAADRERGFDRTIVRNAGEMLDEGRQIFRFDTFGDEDLWGGQLRLHETVRTLTPQQALGLGLKVDSEALPPAVIRKIRQGRVDLKDPAVTLDLLRRRAVVGVTGFFSEGGELTSIGIQCALCHSNVDDSVAPGIGARLDGWPNSDLNVGAIIASAPTVQPFAQLLGLSEAQVRAVLNSWGPGKFDAELVLDGKAVNPLVIRTPLPPLTNQPAATLNPPAFGLAGVNNHTWTGAWGTVSYWNAFVANLEMRGKGTFFDPRLDDPVKYPIAAAHPDLFGHKRDPVDLITGKLPALHFYQLAIPKPEPPGGTFNPAAAKSGEALFAGRARCGECHVPPGERSTVDMGIRRPLVFPVRPTFTDPGWNLHTGAEIGIEEFQAQRAPDDRYRTAVLRALWDTQKIHKRGFYHDGRFPTLDDVVNHYDVVFGIGLMPAEKSDLLEFLKSL